ncbi:MAG: TonB family protein [Desulfocurvibacter africanus]
MVQMKSLALTLSIFLHVALFGMALYMSRGTHVRVDLDVPVYNVDLVSLGRPGPAPKAPPVPVEQPKAPEAPKAPPAPEAKAVEIKEQPAPQPKPEAKPAPEAKPVAKPKPKQPEATDISPKKTDKAPPKPKAKPKEPTAQEIMAEALKAAKTDASKKPQPSPQEVLKRELAALQKEVGSSPAAATAAGNVGASTGQQVYAQDAVARIKPNWRYPLAGTNQNLSAAVEMSVTPDGTITAFKLLKPSGRADFDASVLKAVDETKKLSPPPANMRTIQITFHLQDLKG